MSRQSVSVAGHFGEWIQGRAGPDGPVVLVTVRCPALHVAADWTGVGPGTALPYTPVQLAKFADELGVDPEWPVLSSNIRLGCGAGASTAMLVALAKAHGARIEPERLAAACLAIEGATDPLMFDAPDQLLWASREGRAVERLAPPPAALIVGGFWGDPVRTDPDDDLFPQIGDLIDDWRGAVRLRDGARAAAVATASAERCTALRGPVDPMADLVRDLGALGYIRAHTGSARGLIFAPGTDPGIVLPALAEAGLRNGFAFETGAA